jgi:hypothetical protein
MLLSRSTLPAFVAGAVVFGQLVPYQTATGHSSPTYRDLDAHVHGVAQLNVAVDRDHLLIELDTPAMNLVGFEHPPETDEQRAAVDAARRTLKDGDQLFAPNAEADCALMSAQVDLDLSASSEHGHAQSETHHHDGMVHNDAHAEYIFHCRRPAALRGVDIGLFDAFPRTERVRVQRITATRQDAQELRPDDDRLAL